jgi:WhiB family transcriptional regulator, redox-sensing transcriptional regulator
MTASCVSTLESDEAEIGAAIDDAMDPISRRAPAGLPCQVRDADLWFAETPGELELAKSLCELCPALNACLVGALERREPCGVWGGQIFERGSIVARKRPRGRLRKIDREIAA